jgi:hypothetical protein
MKREKKLTKRERKALEPRRAAPRDQAHIHCIACGRHVDPSEFASSPPSATYIVCEHRSSFPTCVGCSVQSQMLVAQHDRTGQPVKSAAAWH